MCQTELKTHHTCEACLLCDGCIEVGVTEWEEIITIQLSSLYAVSTFGKSSITSVILKLILEEFSLIIN